MSSKSNKSIFLVGHWYTEEEMKAMQSVYHDAKLHPDFFKYMVNHPIYGNIGYATYLWKVISELDEQELDRYGDFVPGMPNALVDVYTKVFLWLEGHTQDETACNAIIYSSSDFVLGVIQWFVDQYNDIVEERRKGSVKDLYEELKEDLFDYLSGC